MASTFDPLLCVAPPPRPAIPSPVDVSVEVNLLVWWEVNEHKFLNVARMARQFLATPASTGGGERFFSGYTQMHSDLRKRLKDAFVEDIVFAAEP